MLTLIGVFTGILVAGIVVIALAVRGLTASPPTGPIRQRTSKPADPGPKLTKLGRPIEAHKVG